MRPGQPLGDEGGSNDANGQDLRERRIREQRTRFCVRGDACCHDRSSGDAKHFGI
jgi:hypothetical protein